MRINSKKFYKQLVAADLQDVACCRNDETGDVDFALGVSEEDKAAYLALVAAHDPDAVDPKDAALEELAALEAAPFLVSRALEDIYAALGPDAAASVSPVTAGRIARKKELRAILAQ